MHPKKISQLLRSPRPARRRWILALAVLAVSLGILLVGRTPSTVQRTVEVSTARASPSASSTHELQPVDVDLEGTVGRRTSPAPESRATDAEARLFTPGSVGHALTAYHGCTWDALGPANVVLDPHESLEEAGWVDWATAEPFVTEELSAVVDRLDQRFYKRVLAGRSREEWLIDWQRELEGDPVALRLLRDVTSELDDSVASAVQEAEPVLRAKLQRTEFHRSPLIGRPSERRRAAKLLETYHVAHGWVCCLQLDEVEAPGAVAWLHAAAATIDRFSRQHAH